MKPSPGLLRNVIIPSDLISTFLQLSKVNSEQNKETLGTLGGVECQNDEFRVTHLLIPRQTGYSDSCIMHSPEVLWEMHEREDIVLLGWIHTHPAYSVFLSSVDMHMQFHHQRMLPEVSKFYTDNNHHKHRHIFSRPLQQYAASRTV